jgi:hypothetical protein
LVIETTANGRELTRMKQQNGKRAGPKQGRATSLEIEAAWRKEVAGRIDEIKSGRAKLIPAEEVHRRARSAMARAV